jgi:hypothetical protein
MTHAKTYTLKITKSRQDRESVLLKQLSRTQRVAEQDRVAEQEITSFASAAATPCSACC